MLPDHLKRFSDHPIRVLDDGHVMLVSVMDDEQAIIDAARVSYGAGTKRVLEDRHLLRYLMRHHHSTPFEMLELKLRVRVPMDVWRQWIRHRTASVNEYSTRYSEAIDSTVKTEEWRLQAQDNKQGSAGFLEGQWPEGFRLEPTEDCPFGAWLGERYFTSPSDYLTDREEELHRESRAVYNERLTFKIAREQARKDLPLSTYTEAYWKCDLRNLLNFLQLRLDPHAQLEIRLYAEAIAQIVKAWVPNVWEAFEDYVLEAQSYSALELDGLRAMIGVCLGSFEGEKTPDKARDYVLQHAFQGSGLKGRELEEFKVKVAKLLYG